ncbi:hypothetical protein GLP37_03655 [Photobacterium phosphoreum]|uniref:GapS1 family protein n=1 Tax=Photobacterium phosphoreum TaxID=659 RepID=UPI001E4E8B21|nr:hypothetical protein [Photobacterium phosphoreum]MCD9501292.1 hypothetical protein [Photobacterium phosphoreum]
MQYQRKIKKVKSLLRGYDAADLAETLYQYMNVDVENDVERLRRLPWLIMLILKWNFLENRVHSESAKALSNKEFMKILDKAYDLGNFVKMPTDVTHFRNMLRNIAFQQFIYQKPLSTTSVATNHRLFSELPDNHRLKAKFKNITNIDIKDFNKCCLVIYAAFVKFKKTISINDLEIIFEKVGKDNLEKTLDLLSVDLYRAKQVIKDNDSSNGTYSEWYEQTPFLKFPIIKHDNKYTCVNIYVLLRTIENYIYDLLKSSNPEYFMDSFGKIFETYLNNGLLHSGCLYVEESALKKGLPKGVGVVDFVITEQESSVFIDAKGVELPYLGKVSDDPKVILGKVKSSALKAIKQANSLNNHVYSNGSKVIKFKRNNYLLVVTYKELYLGNGKTFYDSIAKEAIDEIYKGIATEARIPLNHIYFISIEAFDLLCSIINRTDLTLDNIIEHAKKSDQDESTSKFDFQQHLKSLDVNIQRPDYLDNAIKELTDLIP